MFCQKCGAEVDDEAVICIKCGFSTNKKTQTTELDEPKTGMGVLMGIFLGLIGLIIGICLYKENTVARKTFIKAWAIAFAISFVVAIIIYIVVLGSVMTSLYVY